MENVKNKDLPAFACVGYDGLSGGYHQFGLTKREYFAAKAMQGYLIGKSPANIRPEMISELSVKMADAILEALEEKA